MGEAGNTGLQSAATRLSRRFRQKRDRALRGLIDRLHAPDRPIRILDMGGATAYWERVGFDFLRQRRCEIVILNSDPAALGSAPADLFELTVGDATAMPQYADKSFDLAHSNSVIEHLWTWGAMHRFADETRRVARHYYLQTPNFWFPVDPHYYRFPMFHWLPRPLRASLFYRFPIAQGGRMPTWDKAFLITDASRLLVRRQLEVLFPGAAIASERLLGLPKSWVVTGSVGGEPLG